MKRAYSRVGTRQTPQSQPILGSSQVANSAGGFSWEIDKWQRLERFLILGSEGGTYYIKEQKLTEENAKALAECTAEDGIKTLDIILEVSENNRAPKQDPTLWAWAYVMAHGDVDARRYAAMLLHRVARTGSMLFTFCEYALQFRSWGPVLRRAVQNWYLMKDEEGLAYQMVKYRNRGSFNHKRLLNVTHPDPTDTGLENVMRWAHGDYDPVAGWDELPRIITGFEKLKRNPHLTPKTVARLITQYHLPWEAVPTESLNEPIVMEALLEHMPVMATIRQLPKLTSMGVLKPGNWDNVQFVLERLKEVDKARVHPLQILFALKTYASGHGFKGKLEWNPVEQIIEALDGAFYTSFGNVEPTGKTIVIGLDVSSSMDGSKIAGTNISAREAACAMAMVTAAVESRIVTLAFSHELIQFHIKPRQTLEGVIEAVRRLPFGRTDCALPILGAMEQEIPVDAFIIYTDSETWAGRIHPAQALKQYRNKWNNKAKSIVVGMTSNGFTIADPNDPGMMDVVGFDTAVPQVMSDFIGKD